MIAVQPRISCGPPGTSSGSIGRDLDFVARGAKRSHSSDPSPALVRRQNAAGHTHIDTSLLYTLHDLSEQDRAIRAHQERILGKSEQGIQ